MGILCLMSFIMAIYFITIDRKIRIKGTVIKAPIVELYGRISRPNGGCSVLINGKIFNAGSVYDDSFSLGDSILVRYIPNEYCVVQERVNPKRYYFYYSISSLLLFSGIALTIESFKGKKFSDYKSHSNEEIIEWLLNKIRIKKKKTN